jgi:hypothetical protein
MFSKNKGEIVKNRICNNRRKEELNVKICSTSDEMIDLVF